VQWLQHCENLLSRYPHIVAAIESLSTFAAVITSLVLAGMAQRSNRTKLEADGFIGEVHSEAVDPKTHPRYLVVSITNTGLLPLRIPYGFFYFKIPLRRALSGVLPLDSTGAERYLPRRTYPVPLASRTTEPFYITTEERLYAEFEKLWKIEPKWRKPLFRFMGGLVVTDDGRRFKVTLTRDIQQKILGINSSAG